MKGDWQWNLEKKLKIPFTPTIVPLPALFGAARDGVELLLLLIIPVAAIFGIIVALEYIGAWGPFEAWLGTTLGVGRLIPQQG